MSFKNNLKSKQAQSVVEYIVTFIVLTAIFTTGIVACFDALNPGSTGSNGFGIVAVFNRAVRNAISAFAQIDTAPGPGPGPCWPNC